jgi:hypothetical protein
MGQDLRDKARGLEKARDVAAVQTEVSHHNAKAVPAEEKAVARVDAKAVDRVRAEATGNSLILRRAIKCQDMTEAAPRGPDP